MCGIVGFTGSHNAKILASMSEAIHHRGPDGAGSFLDREAGVGLAARRLAIVDRAGGEQPFSDPSGRYHLVFNGEIYNATELRTELARDGWPLATSSSDTECLLTLYIAHGPAMLERLIGMFAFVIYDRVAGLLFGARDRIGIKPLYYHWRDGRLAFASELKALLACPRVARTIDLASLYHYASLQFVSAPGSIFAEVRKLAAGHWLRLDLATRQLRIERYWTLNPSRTEQHSTGEWQERLSHELRRAVTLWSRGDVPVACSLSGGIDSAGIVGLLAESGYSELHTYSVGFADAADRDCDELALARRVAKRCGSRHQEIRISADTVADDLEAMVYHLDEPYAGGLPSWYVYRAMAKDFKVALTGIGADELFGSYGKYRIFEAAPLTRIKWRLRQAHRFGLATYLLPKRDAPHGQYFHQYLSDAYKRRYLFDPRVRAETSTEALIEQGWHESGADNARDAVAWLEFRHQLPEEFLHVTDRFSMAHSVEARTPYLDHRLVETVFSMPAALRSADQPYKRTLRALLHEVVPDEVLNARKRGFILPLRDWTRGPLRERILDTLSPTRLREHGLFSEQVSKHLLQPHMRARRDFTRQVWMLFMFQLWYDRFA